MQIVTLRAAAVAGMLAASFILAGCTGSPSSSAVPAAGLVVGTASAQAALPPVPSIALPEIARALRAHPRGEWCPSFRTRAVSGSTPRNSMATISAFTSGLVPDSRTCGTWSMALQSRRVPWPRSTDGGTSPTGATPTF